MNDTNKTNTQGGVTPTTPTNEGDKGGKTFTQEEVNNIVSERLKAEKTKNEESIKNAVAGAIAEYERQAKLTQEEKEKEAKTKREAELKAREDEITLRENRVKAQELLATNNIPIDLVDFVVDLDATKMQDKIDTLAKTYNKSVETGVTDKLKGNPPKDFSNDNNGDSKPKYTGTVAF